MSFFDPQSKYYIPKIVITALAIFVVLILLSDYAFDWISIGQSSQVVASTPTATENQPQFLSSTVTVPSESQQQYAVNILAATIIAVVFFAFAAALTIFAMFKTTDEIKPAIQMLTTISAIFGVLIGAIPGYYFGNQVNKTEVKEKETQIKQVEAAKEEIELKTKAKIEKVEDSLERIAPIVAKDPTAKEELQKAKSNLKASKEQLSIDPERTTDNKKNPTNNNENEDKSENNTSEEQKEE